MKSVITSQDDLLPNGMQITDPVIFARWKKLKDLAPDRERSDATDYEPNEIGIAEIFADVYRDVCRYCPERKSWYIYTGGKWIKDLDGLDSSLYLKECMTLLLWYVVEIKDETAQKEWLKITTKLTDRRVRDRVLKDAKENLKISALDFDSNPFLINCRNGTYDLSTGKFREPSPDDFLTMQTNFDYCVRPKPCERWVQFVSEVTCKNKEKADFLQRALGYSLAGTASEECMFILYGKTTRNGKSTMLDAIEHLLGDYACPTPVSIICKTDRAKNAEAASPILAGLKGRRFVTMAESNQYGRLDEEQIKQLTGGERISARNLYESPIFYTPQFKMWLSCNDLPSVTDKSIFASDRIKVITFDRHFGEDERDTSLKSLFRDPEAMQGIFLWLIQGYKKYKKDGLKMPDCVKSAVKQYEKDNDLIGQFLEERTQRSVSKTKAKDLYDTYKLWCKSNEYYVCSAKKFTAGVREHPKCYTSEIMQKGYLFFTEIELT